LAFAPWCLRILNYLLIVFFLLPFSFGLTMLVSQSFKVIDFIFRSIESIFIIIPFLQSKSLRFSIERTICYFIAWPLARTNSWIPSTVRSSISKYNQLIIEYHATSFFYKIGILSQHPFFIFKSTKTLMQEAHSQSMPNYLFVLFIRNN